MIEQFAEPVAQEGPMERVHVETRERLAIVTLQSPPLNIFDFDLIEACRSAFKALSRTGVTVGILRSGVPGAFSSGVDVRIHTPELAPRMLKRFHDLVRIMDKGDIAFIAEVDGVCLGGGFELALMCDFIVASPKSQFGFPEIDLGCFPPVAAVVLPRLSPAAAASLVLTGRRMGGQGAERLGLIHEVAEKPSVAAEHLAATLLSKSGQGLIQARRALRAGRRGSFDAGLTRTERIYERGIIPSADAREGVAAFLEKRPPIWRHE